LGDVVAFSGKAFSLTTAFPTQRLPIALDAILLLTFDNKTGILMSKVDNKLPGEGYRDAKPSKN
jgi:hypothetical protein